MRSSNQLEIILFSKYSLKDVRQKQLVRWLGTTAQTVIALQQAKTKRINLITLNKTPAIYMS